jgi:hypothetical protein
MTVGELIRRLQAFDHGLRVVTRGFDESNLEDVETVEPVRVVFHDEKPARDSIVGRHREAPQGQPAVFINFD